MPTKAARGQMGYSILPELAEGQELHLSLLNPSSPSSTERTALTCTIAKAFRPFTISPVLLVSFVPPPTPTQPHGQLSLPPNMVLKLYDKRCLSNVRDQWDERRPWSLEKEHEYRQYLDDVASGAVVRGYFEDERFLCDNDVSDGEFEAYLQHMARNLFDAEHATYERLRPLQEKKIPRVYGVVEYGVAIPDACTDGSAVTETMPGLLMEYISPLTLWQLIETWRTRDPPLPNRILATLCEEAVQVVERVSDFEVLNEDVHMNNFLIREPFVTSSAHGEPEGELVVVEDAVVLIDLGHCRLRREDESEDEWVKAKWSQDETGAAGVVAAGLVRKFVGEDVWTYQRNLRYYRPSLREDSE